MSDLVIRIEGLDKLREKLGAVASNATLSNITLAVAELLRERIAEAAGPVHQPVHWASYRQMRWYFAARREAGLPLEYTRNSDPWSQTLEKSWTASHISASVNAQVGTRAEYARWVQSAEFQQPMHKETGWKTDVEAIRETVASGDIQKAAKTLFEAAWARGI